MYRYLQAPLYTKPLFCALVVSQKKVAINKKMVFPKEIMELVGVTIIECSHPLGVKPKMRVHKLRYGVYLASGIEVKGVKQGYMY
jgi:hypothetical protein